MTILILFLLPVSSLLVLCAFVCTSKNCNCTLCTNKLYLCVYLCMYSVHCSSFPYFIKRLAVPVELRQGDSILINCTYQSTEQTSVVTFGEGDSKEMCYAFLTYFPVNPQFIICAKNSTVDVCTNVPDRCTTNGFYTLTSAISGVCMSPASCSSTCKDLIQTIVNTGCVTDDYLRLIPYYSNQTTQSLAITSSRYVEFPIIQSSPRVLDLTVPRGYQ